MTSIDRCEKQSFSSQLYLLQAMNAETSVLSRPEEVTQHGINVDMSRRRKSITFAISSGRSKTEIFQPEQLEFAVKRLHLLQERGRTNPYKGETPSSLLWLLDRQTRYTERVSRSQTPLPDHKILRRGSIYHELRGSGVQEITCDKRQRMYSLLKEAMGYTDDDDY